MAQEKAKEPHQPSNHFFRLTRPCCSSQAIHLSWKGPVEGGLQHTDESIRDRSTQQVFCPASMYPAGTYSRGLGCTYQQDTDAGQKTAAEWSRSIMAVVCCDSLLPDLQTK